MKRASKQYKHSLASTCLYTKHLLGLSYTPLPPDQGVRLCMTISRRENEPWTVLVLFVLCAPRKLAARAHAYACAYNTPTTAQQLEAGFPTPTLPQKATSAVTNNDSPGCVTCCARYHISYYQPNQAYTQSRRKCALFTFINHGFWHLGFSLASHYQILSSRVTKKASAKELKTHMCLLKNTKGAERDLVDELLLMCVSSLLQIILCLII